jgi:SET domain-containing protein
MKYYKAKSKIHGTGVFVKRNIRKNEPIGVGIEFILNCIPNVTEHFGVWINHSYTPNTRLKYFNDEWWIFSNKNIRPGTELTVDYRKTPWYIEGPMPHYR